MRKDLTSTRSALASSQPSSLLTASTEVNPQPWNEIETSYFNVLKDIQLKQEWFAGYKPLNPLAGLTSFYGTQV